MSSVSVLVPVFNGEKYLAETLDSVLAQTRPATEIMVFDNCSTDRSVAIAATRVPQALIVTAPENLGAVANLNRSLLAASSEFVLWVAADDRLAPDHIETCLTILEANPGLPACLPGIRLIDPAGQVIRDLDDRDLSSTSTRVRLRAFLRRPRWTEFYCLYRRDALLAAPRLSNEYGADVIFTWWFLLRGPIAVAPRPLLEYREYPAKTQDEMALTLDPNVTPLHWRMVNLWLRLYRMVGEPTVDKSIQKVARRELLLALSDRTWILHFHDDAVRRWPRSRRFLGSLRTLGRRVRGGRLVDG